MSSLSANQRGILAILGCMSAYSVNDALVKKILADYPIGQVIFIRGFLSMMLLGVIVVAFGHAAEIRRAFGRTIAIRSVFDGLATFCFITALAHMAMVNVAAVLQIGPLLLTAMSVIVYRERVGWRGWTAIMVGFAGALLIIRPMPGSFDVFALVAASAALFSALREMQTRRIDSAVPTLVIAFWGAVGIALIGGLFGFGDEWLPMAPGDVVQLVVAAGFVALATYLMAAGYRGVDLSVVAPFRYSYLLTSSIAGYLMFTEVPDGVSIVGALLIVASGLYVLHRETRRRRLPTNT